MMEDVYIAQLEKQFKHYLKNIIAGNAFEPIVLRGGKNRPQTTVELHQMISLFQIHDKSIHPYGWQIEWEEWTSRKLGRQQWPATIKVDTEEDYLFLINKQDASLQFKEQLGRLLAWKPAIRDFLFHKPESVLELKAAWTGICAVVDYLLAYDVSDHYIRSIPVPVHTKFIQQYKNIVLSLLQYLDAERFGPGLKELEEALSLQRKPYLFTIRWLDADAAARFSAGMTIFGATTEYLHGVQWNIKRVILVENETNLFLLPLMPATLAVFSSGKALHLLKEISLFNAATLYYWGDLDEEGFIMLNDIRALYSHVQSLFMDEETVIHHRREMVGQPVSYKTTHLHLLTAAEQGAFEKMRLANGRIEQERLQQAFMAERLLALG